MELATRWYARRRRVGAAPLDRHARGVRERDGARRRDGRLHQHRAAHPRRRAGGRGRLRPGRDRRRLPAGAVRGQGGAELRLPHGGRPPRGRHPRDPRRAAPRRAAATTDVHTVHSPSLDAVARRVGRPRSGAVRRGRGAVPRRAGRGAHHRGVLHDQPLVLARHRRGRGLHPRRRARVHRRRRARRAARQHRPGRRGHQDRRDRRGAVALRRARRGSSRARRRPSR